MNDSESQDKYQPLQGVGQEVGGPRRRKSWDELGLEEKVDRLRDVLRTKEVAIGELREGLGTLMQHQHGKNGELLRPVYGGGGNGQIGRGYDPLA